MKENEKKGISEARGRLGNWGDRSYGNAFQERELSHAKWCCSKHWTEALTHLEQEASPCTSVSRQGHCMAPPSFEHLHPFSSFAYGIRIFPEIQVSNMSGPSKHVYYNAMSPSTSDMGQLITVLPGFSLGEYCLFTICCGWLYYSLELQANNHFYFLANGEKFLSSRNEFIMLFHR